MWTQRLTTGTHMPKPPARLSLSRICGGGQSGRLGAEYAESAKKGWAALAKNAIAANGDVTGVCRGSGYSFRREYYKHELTSKINDVHGIGIVLLAGIEASEL